MTEQDAAEMKYPVDMQSIYDGVIVTMESFGGYDGCSGVGTIKVAGTVDTEVGAFYDDWNIDSFEVYNEGA